jgi:hypothetical protein
MLDGGEVLVALGCRHGVNWYIANEVVFGRKMVADQRYIGVFLGSTRKCRDVCSIHCRRDFDCSRYISV